MWERLDRPISATPRFRLGLILATIVPLPLHVLNLLRYSGIADGDLGVAETPFIIAMVLAPALGVILVFSRFKDELVKRLSPRFDRKHAGQS